MNRIDNRNMFNVCGGATSGITATTLNAFARIVGTLYNIGKAVGSSLRRASSGNICPIN